MRFTFYADYDPDNLTSVYQSADCNQMLIRNKIYKMQLTLCEAADLLFFCSAKWPDAQMIITPIK